MAEGVCVVESLDANGVNRGSALRVTGDRLPVTTDRLSRALLVAHVLLIGFATLAMVTILAGEFPTWMQGPYTPVVYEYAWRYTGQLYVILGLLAAIVFAAPRFGTQTSVVLFLVAAVIALTSELLGTNTGLPFGPYRYTEMLGYRVGGDVPYVIPLSWSYMLFCCLAMCARIVRTDRPWRWAIVAAFMLTAWDVPLEVHMTNVTPAHWVWNLSASPTWLPGWLTRAVFYGMPLMNWVGWLLTATIISRVMLAIVPAKRWRSFVAASAFPLVLYAANGIMPIATVARHGLLWATAAGLFAMGTVLALAIRAPIARAAD